MFSVFLLQNALIPKPIAAVRAVAAVRAPPPAHWAVAAVSVVTGVPLPGDRRPVWFTDSFRRVAPAILRDQLQHWPKHSFR